MSRIVDARSFVTAPDWSRNVPLHNNARAATTKGLCGSIVNEMTKSQDKPPYAGTFSTSPGGDSPWPLSAGELASLVDLGLLDDQIARYFGVDQVKVSALRAYYGLVDSSLEPEVVRGPIQDDGRGGIRDVR